MKLSEFTGVKGVEIAARVMNPIFTLTANEKVREVRAQEGVTIDKVLSAMVMNEPDAAIELYAILNEKDVNEYKETCTAASILNDLFVTFTDDDLMVLFGLRAQKTEKASSTLAMESTEAIEKI